MQEERLDGSYLITKGATEQEILDAIKNETNRSVTVANSVADLAAMKKYLKNSTAPEENKFYIEKKKGKWVKRKY